MLKVAGKQEITFILKTHSILTLSNQGFHFPCLAVRDIILLVESPLVFGFSQPTVYQTDVRNAASSPTGFCTIFK